MAGCSADVDVGAYARGTGDRPFPVQGRRLPEEEVRPMPTTATVDVRTRFCGVLVLDPDFRWGRL